MLPAVTFDDLGFSYGDRKKRLELKAINPPKNNKPDNFFSGGEEIIPIGKKIKK